MQRAFFRKMLRFFNLDKRLNHIKEELSPVVHKFNEEKEIYLLNLIYYVQNNKKKIRKYRLLNWRLQNKRSGETRPYFFPFLLSLAKTNDGHFRRILLLSFPLFLSAAHVWRQQQQQCITHRPSTLLSYLSSSYFPRPKVWQQYWNEGSAKLLLKRLLNTEKKKN